MRQITEKQKEFCTTYLMNGCKAESASLEVGLSHSAGSAILGRENAKQYIEEAREELEELIPLKWKMGKLVQIINLCVPDDATSLDEIDAKAAIAAIIELDQVQGHRAPIKTENRNLTINGTLEQLKGAKKVYTYKEF